MKYIILILLLIIVGCSYTANDNLIQFDVDKSYDVSESFSVENETYIYFAKRKFNPNIIIFNEKGIKIDSVSLKNAERELNEITNVWMSNIDSIFVYSYYTNTTVILNKKGEILGVKSMEGIEDEKGQVYELYPPYGNIESSDNIIFTACLLKKFDDNEYGSWDSFSEYSDAMQNGYLIYKENIGFKLKKTELKGFLAKDSLLFLPLWQTTIANNQFIFNSKYSRYIYLLDNNLSVKRSVEIIPDSITTLQPIMLLSNMSVSDEIRLMSDTNSQKGNIINRIFYDDSKENYILSVIDFDVQTKNYLPFKFYVYDTSFEKIKELNIENRERYNGLNCFYINSNILIERIDNNDDNKRLFEAFKI